MRIVFIHPNYHSGGAEIAGNWPPAWVAYLTGALKNNGFDDIHFIDAMTNHVGPDELRAKLAELQPDVVGATAITPSIYKAEECLRIAKDVCPDAHTVLGGIHATFMFRQVLSEAPWIDVIVRGEGEEIIVNLMNAMAEGRWPADRHKIKGLAFADEGEITATEAAPTVKDLDGIKPDWSILEWDKYIYIPLNRKVAIPNMARGCPFTCSFCSQWKFWRDYRVRDPKKVVDEIEDLVENHGVGFFILADEEPSINKKKFIEFCEELIARGLPERIQWGINTRVTDIMRDKDLLGFYRKAGLVHVSLGTEAAAQMKLDTFNKETTPSPKIRKRSACCARPIFSSRHSSSWAWTTKPPKRWKKPTRWRWDWQPDLANWAMYTPWPFTPLFQELRDQVEVFDYSKYNFVTAHHEACRHDAGRAAGRGAEELPALLHEKGAVPLPVARHGLSAQIPAGLSESVSESGGCSGNSTIWARPIISKNHEIAR